MPAAHQKASYRTARAVPRGLAELARQLARNLLYPKWTGWVATGTHDAWQSSSIPTGRHLHRSRFSPTSTSRDCIPIVIKTRRSTIRERPFRNWPASEHARRSTKSLVPQRTRRTTRACRACTASGTQPALSQVNGMSRHRHSWRLAQNTGAASRRT